MHLLAEREILGKLKAGGLLKGSVEEMVDYRIGALFMPHGILHSPFNIHPVALPQSKLQCKDRIGPIVTRKLRIRGFLV